MMKCGKTKIERYRAHLYRTVKATDLYIVTVFYMITIYIAGIRFGQDMPHYWLK